MYTHKLYNLVDINKFYPRVSAAVGAIDTDLALSYISDAIKDFCRDTHVLPYEVCIPAVSCQSSYLLNIPDGFTVESVLSLTTDATCHTYNLWVENDVLYVDPPPAQGDCDTTFYVRVALSPQRDSAMVPMVLYENWVEAIVHLALAKIYLLSTAEWYNATLAGTHFNLAQADINRALTSKLTKHRPLNITLSAPINTHGAKWRLRR